ncbi:helix-turn-helix domain-containing protein [Cryobacterium sp. SO2]|uniref:winged helix-turn-helix transcriptional regulator n=1 Tax=Cryobacterium sp. SO2 TaxID=1897060 RepID=UPI00223D9C16|nr:helix-turn-helix domain-containing protein [Cryobacterium sp. SO2]WEO77157.1 helix-turn-helix domain-containing protein [Cryobacterium sp. SO2]
MTTAFGPPGQSTGLDPQGTSREVLEHSTGRWGALTLVALVDGPLRFAELGRAVRGISDRMLAQTLQRLEAHGLISRTPHPTVPLRVDYALTDLGRPIARSVRDLIDTIHAQLPGIIAHHQDRPVPPAQGESL